MTDRSKPWHGVMVATALPLREDLTVDYDGYADHCRWLVDNGCDGVVPNGSLGEYQTLTADERARVIRTAVEAVGGDRVMAGVGRVRRGRVAALGRAGGRGGLRLGAAAAAEHLPGRRARGVRRTTARSPRPACPVVAYNNPYDTKVDLVPALLARLHEEGLIVAVKEFTGDPRRAYELAELAPELDLLIGSDDVLLELALAGAVGWVAGYPNALPVSSVALYRAALAGDLDTALPLYRALHPLLRWDSKTEFVQAIKLSMDLAGRHGGPCRPPRQPLTDEQAAVVRSATEKALAEGLR